MRTARTATAGLLAAAAALISVGVAPVGAGATPTGLRHASAPAGTVTPVTRTETVSRSNIVDGKSQVVDKRRVTLHVSDTTQLRGRQIIDVTWSGAHPTGGIVSDVNSIDAQQEEYPFVLLECRGIDSAKLPAAKRLSPQTCWTQSWSERYHDSYSRYPAWRSDRYASAAQRQQVVDAPATLPAACQYLPASTQYWLPFVAASGHVYEGGPAGCAGMPPESASVGGGALPSNETFGVTGTDGRGSAPFDVWTSAENASLGCSQTVACSLVAVPIEGISCDPAGTLLPADQRPSASDADKAASACEATGAFKPGQIVNPQGQEDLAVSGSLWWSPSNWRNRISIPLTFAVPANACDVVNNANSVNIYGSELLIQATDQWAPHFCLDPKLFKVSHVQTGEPEARTLLANGSITAAFTSDAPPDGYGRPVVNAPVAVTGFAISYDIDGANGQPYHHLRLDPRLLAKLLTESYPAELPMQEEDPALAHNPLNVTLDPEFQQLNPGIAHGVAATESAAALLTVSSDSDVMEALTSYINADPAARAWLNGTPDPWGMTVNPKYKGIKLPTDRWPLLDTFEPTKWYQSDVNDCLYTSPVPFLPLVAAPLARLEEVAEALQFSVAQPTTVCSQIDGTRTGEKLVPQGRQPQGSRFMIGVTSLASARRYELPTAALQTTTGHYVAPTDASLRAATGYLTPDAKTGVWRLPYATLRTDAKAASAYPGTMVVYTAAPTQGLPRVDASDVAQLLRFAAGPGQRPGLAVGDLPPGFLPMTRANGMGNLAAYTRTAATAVAAQKGAVPSVLDAGKPQGSGGRHPSRGHGSRPAAGTPGSGPSADGGTPAENAGSGPTGTPPGSSSTGTKAGQSPQVADAALGGTGRTLAIALGGGAVLLLLCLAVGLAGTLGSGGTWLWGRVKRRW